MKNCKVCLKPENFCTCVGANKKHQEHASTIDRAHSGKVSTLAVDLPLSEEKLSLSEEKPVLSEQASLDIDEAIVVQEDGIEKPINKKKGKLFGKK